LGSKCPSGAEAHLLPELRPSKGVIEHKTLCDFLFFFSLVPIGHHGKKQCKVFQKVKCLVLRKILDVPFYEIGLGVLFSEMPCGIINSIGVPPKLKQISPRF
jgi:hypothetical protein